MSLSIGFVYFILILVVNKKWVLDGGSAQTKEAEVR
jgi:hypothetical protein